MDGWQRNRREGALAVPIALNASSLPGLVFDLQFRLRCKGCNRRAGFRITIFDTRTRGDNGKPRLERVVVAGE